jgi:hypothetical protein
MKTKDAFQTSYCDARFISLQSEKETKRNISTWKVLPFILYVKKRGPKRVLHGHNHTKIK